MHANSWYRYLVNRPLFNFTVLLLFYLMVVLPHEQVGIFIASFFEDSERNRYNNLMVMLFTLMALPLSYTFVKRGLLKRNNRYLLLYLLFSLLFVLYCFHFYFVVNVEAIHFVQYFIFSVMLFPLVNNYTQTLGLSTIAGTIDEAYQYFILAPNKTEYFDFNDIIINMVGAGIGLIYIKCSGLRSKTFSFFRSPFFYALLILSLLIVGLYVFNIVSLYPDDGFKFYLCKFEHRDFWSLVNPSVVYHVVRPLEGLIIITGLLIFFSPLDKINYEN